MKANGRPKSATAPVVMDRVALAKQRNYTMSNALSKQGDYNMSNDDIEFLFGSNPDAKSSSDIHHELLTERDEARHWARRYYCKYQAQKRLGAMALRRIVKLDEENAALRQESETWKRTSDTVKRDLGYSLDEITALKRKNAEEREGNENLWKWRDKLELEILKLRKENEKLRQQLEALKPKPPEFPKLVTYIGTEKVDTYIEDGKCEN